MPILQRIANVLIRTMSACVRPFQNAFCGVGPNLQRMAKFIAVVQMFLALVAIILFIDHLIEGRRFGREREGSVKEIFLMITTAVGLVLHFSFYAILYKGIIQRNLTIVNRCWYAIAFTSLLDLARLAVYLMTGRGHIDVFWALVELGGLIIILVVHPLWIIHRYKQELKGRRRVGTATAVGESYELSPTVGYNNAADDLIGDLIG